MSHLDITGALTLGGWFYPQTLGTLQGLMGKWIQTATNNRSYRLVKTAANVLEASVSSNGTAAVTVTGVTTLIVNTWVFAAMRYTPSTEIAVFTNNVKATNVVGVPASLYDSLATPETGRTDAGNYFNGRVGVTFLCAAALTDEQLFLLYSQARAAMGVT